MKLNTPKNVNYAAVVVRIRNLVDLPNADRLVGLPLMGFQAIVSRDTQVGALGVLFTAETQLSEAYCRENNLFRHSELNADSTQVGYLDDNRRVRAIKLRGSRSDALFMPFSSFEYIFNDSNDITSFREGDVFDKIGDEEICRKYYIPVKTPHNAPRTKVDPRVDEKFLPIQPDTAQLLRVSETLNPLARCVVTQKIHGTQIRVANTIVKRKRTWKDKVASIFGVEAREYDYEMVYGSHRVIKDANNPKQIHFYDDDIWTEAGRQLDGLIPEGYVVYAELIGWTPNGAPIQKNYTYNLERGKSQMYIFRVAQINPQGIMCDLSWEAVKEFCASIGIPHVAEMWTGTIGQLLDRQVPDMGAEGPTFLEVHFLDIKFFGVWEIVNVVPSSVVPLCDESPCDEGVCIRIEGIQPLILKAKSPIFLGHETKLLDKGEPDIEAVAMEEV